MKKLASISSSLIAMAAVVFAVSDSAFYVNKPVAPKELLKK